jgi:hypothetical protein
VADAICELRLEANLAGRLQLDPCLTLHLGLLLDLLLQLDHFQLLFPEKENKKH